MSKVLKTGVKKFDVLAIPQIFSIYMENKKQHIDKKYMMIFYTGISSGTFFLLVIFFDQI